MGKGNSMHGFGCAWRKPRITGIEEEQSVCEYMMAIARNHPFTTITQTCTFYHKIEEALRSNIRPLVSFM